MAAARQIERAARIAVPAGSLLQRIDPPQAVRRDRIRKHLTPRAIPYSG
jgi:hypothetical protein